MKALVIGATGATGKDLVRMLLEDESFGSVDIFVRRDVAVSSPKLNVHVVDFDKPEQWSHLPWATSFSPAWGRPSRRP